MSTNILLALAGITVGLACIWIGYRIGHANARAERAFQIEAARGTNTDPDPFADQLRVEHRTPPTDNDTTGDNQ